AAAVRRSSCCSAGVSVHRHRVGGEKRLVEPANQVPNPRRLAEPIDGGAELRRTRQTLRIPGKMLAGDTGPGRDAVKAEHLLVVSLYDCQLLGGLWVRKAPAPAQPGDHLGDEPWPAEAAATDHQTIGARIAERPLGVVEAKDVAVGDYRDRYPV